MRTILYALVLCLSPIVAGCPPEVIPFRAESSVERSYALGETRTASSGETMLTMRSVTNAPTYEVAFDYAPPQHDVFQGGLNYPELSKGMRFTQAATRGDGLIGLGRASYGVTRPARGSRETFLPVIIWIDSNGVVSSSAMEGKSWTSDRLFLPVAAKGASEASRTELVFNNVDGAMLNVTHNEYSGEGSAPLKSRPVRFDISENRTFTYNNFAIEIIEAAPTKIVFRVVRDE